MYYVGIAYRTLGQHDLAQAQLEKALKEAEEKQFGHLALYVRSDLINTLLSQNHLDEAKVYAWQNLRQARDVGNQRAEERALLYLAQIAEDQKDYQQSMYYIDTAFAVSKRLAQFDQDMQMDYLQRKFGSYRQEQEHARSIQELELAHSKLETRNMREDMDKEVNLRDKVVEMERLLEDFSGDKDLNEFELYFKRMGAEFWEKLDSRFPGLQPHDKCLCAFIYLRLGTKEIAAITHRAVRSVYTAKNRLKKKMGLAQDADLQDFLHSL